MKGRAAWLLLSTAIVAAPTLAFAEPAAAARALPGKRVADAALARYRGGTDTASGIVSGNQAINVTTGGNVITGGSFAGAAGVPVVIQNTGNNVLIQSSVTVNVQMK